MHITGTRTLTTICLLVAVPTIFANSFREVQPIANEDGFKKTDSVVPETELAAAGSVCDFSTCPIGTAGHDKKCPVKPEDCSGNWCATARCAEGSAERHFGSAAFAANIQPKCWTQRSSGATCFFDKARTDCAVCVAGGCQCPLGSAAGHQRCVECTKGIKDACNSQVPFNPTKCPPSDYYEFTKHEASQCRGHDEDILRNYVGTVAECMGKCQELNCAAFVYIHQKTSSDQGAQPYGKCHFRTGPLQQIVAQKDRPCTADRPCEHDNRDCYVPNVGIYKK